MIKKTVMFIVVSISSGIIWAAEQSEAPQEGDITRETPFDCSKLSSTVLGTYARVWEASVTHVFKHVDAIKREHNDAFDQGRSTDELAHALLALQDLKECPSHTITNALAIATLKKHFLMDKDAQMPELFILALKEYPQNIVTRVIAFD